MHHTAGQFTSPARHGCFLPTFAATAWVLSPNATGNTTLKVQCWTFKVTDMLCLRVFLQIPNIRLTRELCFSCLSMFWGKWVESNQIEGNGAYGVLKPNLAVCSPDPLTFDIPAWLERIPNHLFTWSRHKPEERGFQLQTKNLWN